MHGTKGSVWLVALLAAAVSMAGFSREEVAISRNSAKEARRVPPLRLTEDLSIGAFSEEEGPTLGFVSDVAASADGEIYVLDSGSYCVQVFSNSGALLRKISNKGEGPGEILRPSVLALGPHDRLYVAEAGKVMVFATAGEYLEQFQVKPAGSYIRAMAVDADGNVYVLSFDEREHKLIHKYGPDHQLIMSFCDTFAAGKSVDIRIERFAAGGGIDLTANGNLLFTQAHPYEIRLFSPGGELLRQVHRETDFVKLPDVEITESGVAFTFRGGCYGIVALPSGVILNSATRPEISEREYETLVDCFSPEGKLLASHLGRGFFRFTCADSLGRVYAAHLFGEHPRVVRYRVDW